MCRVTGGKRVSFYRGRVPLKKKKMEKGRSRWGQKRERCSGAYVKFTIILTILHDNLKKLLNITNLESQLKVKTRQLSIV